jgi:hypothetical protein
MTYKNRRIFTKNAAKVRKKMHICKFYTLLGNFYTPMCAKSDTFAALFEKRLTPKLNCNEKISFPFRSNDALPAYDAGCH